MSSRVGESLHDKLRFGAGTEILHFALNLHYGVYPLEDIGAVHKRIKKAYNDRINWLSKKESIEALGGKKNHDLRLRNLKDAYKLYERRLGKYQQTRQAKSTIPESSSSSRKKRHSSSRTFTRRLSTIRENNNAE
jgi:hypothetical protein